MVNNNTHKSLREKKTALITGSSSGIGYEFSKLFAKDGYNLVLVARNKQKLKLFLPGMLIKGYGNVLNVGSTGSFVPGGPLNAVYCATKAFVLSFSEAIAEELQGTGISVTTLCPGATKTEFSRKAHMEDTKLFKKGVINLFL